MRAKRKKTRTADKISHLNPQAADREHTGDGFSILKSQRLPPVTTTLPMRSHLSILPKQFQ